MQLQAARCGWPPSNVLQCLSSDGWSAGSVFPSSNRLAWVCLHEAGCKDPKSSKREGNSNVHFSFQVFASSLYHPIGQSKSHGYAWSHWKRGLLEGRDTGKGMMFIKKRRSYVSFSFWILKTVCPLGQKYQIRYKTRSEKHPIACTLNSSPQNNHH